MNDGPAHWYAHSLPGRPEEEWEPLADHLDEVAAQAAEFASAFGAGAWGRTAGLWHDLGKFSREFQKHLGVSSLREADDEEDEDASVARRGKVDHTSAGAQHAVARLPVLGHLLAFAIAGHHAGLHDARAETASLEARLSKTVPDWSRAPSSLLDAAEFSCPQPLPPPLDAALGSRDPFGVAFFARMLFSCLVDADFLCTERFLQPARSVERPRYPEDALRRLEEALVEHLKSKEASAEVSEVNRARREVREACAAAADREPGFFSLTVPTGGGKTLSSLAFALGHARAHALRRVIYVVPFTSIIEQNADVFRRATKGAWGPQATVLEHHSNLAEAHESSTSRLAAENWDAPLVVTTAVQFFESLFAHRPSRCRKLHNLARAVIVLDEAQTLPVDLLQPCLAALRELVRGYGATVVLCTATQPALGRRERFEIGLEGVREIAPEPEELYQRLRRVEVVDLGTLEDLPLCERLAAVDQVLCIVNTRGHARSLAERLINSGAEAIHLSALMCPVHRSEKLDEARARLARHQPCRVVSTRLVEAGVDLDFPVVYRALAGIDAIAQAAGRCNREGREACGQTFVFRSEHVRAEAYLRDTSAVACEVFALHRDPLSLAAVEQYFRLYYWEQSARWDRLAICGELHLDPRSRDLPFLFGFATIAERFRLIEETQKPVIVPWGEKGRQICRELRNGGELPSWRIRRALQRYTVTIPARTWELEAGRSFELVHGRFAVLYATESSYSEEFGLTLAGVEGRSYVV